MTKEIKMIARKTLASLVATAATAVVAASPATAAPGTFQLRTCPSPAAGWTPAVIGTKFPAYSKVIDNCGEYRPHTAQHVFWVDGEPTQQHTIITSTFTLPAPLTGVDGWIRWAGGGQTQWSRHRADVPSPGPSYSRTSLLGLGLSGTQRQLVDRHSIEIDGRESVTQTALTAPIETWGGVLATGFTISPVLDMTYTLGGEPAPTFFAGGERFRAVTWRTECRVGSTETLLGCSAHSIVSAINLTVSDPTPPTVSLNTEPVSGQLTGTLRATLDVADEGAGVQRVEAAIDGRPFQTWRLESAASSCPTTLTDQPVYDTVQPCPSGQRALRIEVDTTKAPEGTGSLTIRAVDAAGNVSVVSPSSPAMTVQVNNNDVAAPLILSHTLPAQDATVKGTMNVAATTRDDLSGVRAIELRSGDRVLGTIAHGIDSATDACRSGAPALAGKPLCPLTLSGRISVDTSTLPEGPATLTLRVADAAGNVSIETRRVTIDNLTPAAEQRQKEGVVAAGTVCEQSPSGGWLNPDAQITPVEGESSQRSRATKLTASFQRRLVKSGRATVRRSTRTAIAPGSRVTLGGRLTLATGQGTSGQVRVAVRRAGGRWTLCPEVRTTAGDDGTWKAEIRGLTRSVEVTVLHFLDKTTNDVVQGPTLLVGVQRPVTLKARKRGGRTVFTGRVGGVSPAGTKVRLTAVRPGAKDVQFVTATVGKGGRFKTSWNFGQVRSIRVYAFVEGSADYASSKSRRVTVRR